MNNHSTKPSEKFVHSGARRVSPLRELVRKLFEPQYASDLQSGQAIVLMALMMLGLMAMLGLAIDGGGLFFLHRDTQNATDAAVIAATYARCTSDDPEVVEFAGYQAAARNGFGNSGVSDWVEVHNPPNSGTGAGDEDYVEVMITAAKPSYFIQLVFPEPLRVTSRAVGRCSPPFDPATLPALLALSTTCNNTVNWTGAQGNISTMVSGGAAIHSNYEVKSGGGGQGNSITGTTTAVGSVNQGSGGNTTWNPAPQANLGADYIVDDPISEHFPISDFAPGGEYARRAQSQGLYTSINSTADDPDMKSNGTWDPRNGRVLNGLYYVNGDVRIGNGVSYGVNGITIVATGEISFSGGVNLHYYMDGFLLYSGYQARNCGDNAISISGSSGYWYGVIYAPGGGVNISASDIEVTGAIIADTIDFSGSTLDLVYDPDILNPIPASVVVSE
ncbi:MAG TPA: pilus assembly protein TadG-related protein [Oceanobacillus sp.]|nr:pilus assembly protein TadG-related protein [Oceanobacillus sp.]